MLSYKLDLTVEDCKAYDVVYIDMFDNSEEFIKECAKHTEMYCYYSTQYEKWRPDAGKFGKLGSKLDNWPGERWVDPNDPKNLKVLTDRNTLALQKGCEGADFDNIDRDGHGDYVLKIFEDAHAKGLKISHKNAAKLISRTKPYINVIQSEQCHQYNECDTYQHGLPHFDIEYKSKYCKPYGKTYVVYKYDGMSRKQKVCN